MVGGARWGMGSLIHPRHDPWQSFKRHAGGRAHLLAPGVVDVDEVVGKIERNGARRRLARSYDEHMARRRTRHMDWNDDRSSHDAES